MCQSCKDISRGNTEQFLSTTYQLKCCHLLQNPEIQSVFPVDQLKSVLLHVYGILAESVLQFSQTNRA